ncbi:Clavaminate synthase-like protein [Xylaria nigripes]|nr:Clavaminate synthase-like protein [Xylaria nigripes]
MHHLAFDSITGRLHQGLRRCMKLVPRASFYSTCGVIPATTTDGSIDVATFRSLAWESAIPLHLQNFHRLPAVDNWFTSDRESSCVSFGCKLLSYANTRLSYELITAPDGDRFFEANASDKLQHLRDFHTWLGNQLTEGDDALLYGLISHLLESMENGRSHFLQFEAPLSLMIRAYQYNKSTDKPSSRIRQLYVAQSHIGILPMPLREDLPVPEIVRHVGNGDIYGSSIWLGLQPTYTPLHRDPNPNLFCQLVGSKAVRLLRPKAGLSVFQQVRRSLGASGNSRLRGPEMMEGPERDGIHRAIWADHDVEGDIWQAMLEPGDALFIPQGWWHSVMSIGCEAELNASANWWFR